MTGNVVFTDGDTLAFRARERPHLIFNEASGEPTHLCNGVGNPGPGQNVGIVGRDHTFVQCVELNTRSPQLEVVV